MSRISFEKFELSNYADCAIVTDGKLAKLYNIKGDNVYVLPQGERAKSFKHVKALCSWFLSRRLAPTDTVVAVGGGSVGDTVGFATSIYKRGLNILHVPTTLLAQVDSSIGGKTAIDLDGVKNAVGSYHFGDTLIDVDFLKTLDMDQITNGQGEIMKYRMLCDEVNKADNNGKGSTLEIIKACVSYKQHLCDIDPYCKGERNKLNFGHTVGHALELHYKISHGMAVIYGIFYETKLAARLGICSREYADKWTWEIEHNYPFYPLNRRVLTYMLNDKKNAHGKIGFVLPEDFSQTYLTPDEVEELLLK